MTEDDFEYALENARVVIPPRRKIETFGTSVFNYYMVTEDMDHIHLSRVREGRIQAERPQVITPSTFSKLLVEGFGEDAQEFAEQFSTRGRDIALLKYGFQLRRESVKSYEVQASLEEVLDRVKQDVQGRDDPLATVVSGIEEGWETGLLKLMLQMILTSAGANLQELRGRGLL